MASTPLKIVGHSLCPYVQRVVIVMLEHGIAYERTDIDLNEKPAWLAEISPTRKVPVFRVGPNDWLFESGVIARYLDESSGGGLLPGDALTRARHEAWISYADDMLDIVARIIYDDQDAAAVDSSMTEIAQRLNIVAASFAPRRYFAGAEFGLIDAVFATLFRYFPVLDRASTVTLAGVLPGALAEWWNRVQRRPSVRSAVPEAYQAELTRFVAAKSSHAGRVLAGS